MTFPRFVIAGAVNTVVTYLLYLALLPFMPYLWAYVLTYAVGIALGYVLNAVWVFRGRPSLRTASAYPLLYLLNLALGIALLACLVELLRVPREWAPIIVIAVSLPIMFLLNRMLFQRGDPA
jgi:putative flippase GtrA